LIYHDQGTKAHALTLTAIQPMHSRDNAASVNHAVRHNSPVAYDEDERVRNREAYEGRPPIR
jgi:hypothetical protein